VSPGGLEEEPGSQTEKQALPQHGPFSLATLAVPGAPTLGTPPPRPFFPVALELHTS